jgi:4'-phosphopantetheinyl transferase
MSNQWNLPDILPPLKDDEVQVWRIGPDRPAGSTDHLASFLSTEEKIHASRLRIGQAQNNFTIGRACLRILLGNALEIDPREVVIAVGAHGKPETPAIGAHRISFNIAHSKDTILIALCRLGDIGVDIEHLDRATDIMEVAEAHFTRNESNSLEAIANLEERRKTFYHYWTRKEAVGKAEGQGLLLPLNSFDVSFKSMTLQPVRVNESPGKEGKLYFVTDLDLGTKAVAALALDSSRCRINTMTFPPSLCRAAEAGT